MAVDPRVVSTNARIRTAARIGGVLVVALGLFLFIHNGANVIHGINQSSDLNSPDFASGPPIGAVLGTMGGFLMTGVGLQLLYVGFLRTATNYVAGEASPALRSVAGDVAGGIRDGLAGVTGGAVAGHEQRAERTGPFCSACGVRNDAGAHFCDACGAPLSQP